MRVPKILLFMSLTIGIIGLPQSGKTTLFHSLTRLNASKRTGSGHKPNQAHVLVPDSRLDRLSAIFEPRKTTPATVDFLDVAAAGGESEEKGALGRRVLGSFRTVDTLLEVVRCFPHQYLGAPHPVDDLENLELELLISDLTVVQNTLERNKKMAADARVWFDTVRSALEEGRRPATVTAEGDAASAGSTLSSMRSGTVPESARPFLQSMSLLVGKPCIVCANIADDQVGSEENDPLVGASRKWAAENQRRFFTVCAAIEEEIAQLSPEEVGDFLADLGIAESGLDKLIQAAYRSLDLMTFFTVGEDECRAWTVRVGATAPQAAGKIHSDLEKGFIRAEVVTADDLLEQKSIAACRDKGMLRVEGRSYVVKDGDVLNIRFNV